MLTIICRCCHRPGTCVKDGRGTRTVYIHKASHVGHPFEVMEVGR